MPRAARMVALPQSAVMRVVCSTTSQRRACAQAYALGEGGSGECEGDEGRERSHGATSAW